MMDQGRVFAPSGDAARCSQAGHRWAMTDRSEGLKGQGAVSCNGGKQEGRKGSSSCQESAHQLPCGIAVPIAGSGRIRPKDAQVRWRLSHGLETFQPNRPRLRRETPSLERDILRSDDAAKQPPRLHPAPRQAPNAW